MYKISNYYGMNSEKRLYFEMQLADDMRTRLRIFRSCYVMCAQHEP
jgi:hypothetical protein